MDNELKNGIRVNGLSPDQFILIDRSIVLDGRLSATELGVLAHVFADKAETWINAPERLAERARLTVAGVKDALLKLQDLGYITTS